ncbi:MAG TPA: microcin ABC transporter ATP-binding protein [Gammaproteobacteria bacterium]|nr:microcin ABC transporter ATP-binding protein [Gammaproteobacteria bacterium]HCK93184.1 microcin ABC transporter ATP-binding protein [Gammaproteobacteria bacterium]|tara:strand:+ start:107037 stop:108713 length:1677 start_codon:yes stop_codon:yes gene_type:complete
MTINSKDTLLSLQHLQVAFNHFDQTKQSLEWKQVVHDVSFDIKKGEILALVGESGSGKSVSAMSTLNLFSPGSAQLKGTLEWEGKKIEFDSLACSARRGSEVGVIFQEPMTSLNPLHRIEKQLNEIQLLHQSISKAAASKRSLELLEWVGIPNPAQKLKAYPHELSGGQRQRVMIAMALANNPKLLIADEPTTALDVTIQKMVVELLLRLQKETGMAILFISHDLNLVRKLADRVVVMHHGKSIETNTTEALFAQPQQDYTKMLLNSAPSGYAPEVIPQPEILRLENLKVWFPIKAGLFQKTVDYVKAVKNMNLQIQKGMTYGIVGESGSGKTTLGMAILRLIESEGGIIYDHQPLQDLDRKALRPFRRRLQVVFQDPFSSLSPRMTIQEMLEEGLKLHGESLGMPSGKNDQQAWLDRQVTETLTQVELDPDVRFRFPHEFSGGQRQRIAIARALAIKPEFIVLDEPTSALDRTIQKQLIDLLVRLQQETGMTYLFISHDLAVVKAVSHNILVMKDGEVVEQNDARTLFESPQHPYTQALLEAALFTHEEPASNKAIF